MQVSIVAVIILLHFIHEGQAFTTFCRKSSISAINTRVGAQNDDSSNFDYHLKEIEKFDEEYRRNIVIVSKRTNTNPQILEFRSLQGRNPNDIQAERSRLRQSCIEIASAANQVVLGITCRNGIEGVEVLRSWVDGLGLPRGYLRGLNDLGEEVEYTTFDSAEGVYIKYNSTDAGNAYMKSYAGLYYGVLFQPLLADGDFRQYGNFPLTLFRSQS